MLVPALQSSAPCTVKIPANLGKATLAVSWWLRGCDPDYIRGWVEGATACCTVIAQAVGTSRDCSGPTCEGLIIEAAVQNRPIEVLPGQGVPAVLAIIYHPLKPLVIPLG